MSNRKEYSESQKDRIKQELEQHVPVHHLWGADPKRIDKNMLDVLHVEYSSLLLKLVYDIIFSDVSGQFCMSRNVRLCSIAQHLKMESVILVRRASKHSPKYQVCS